MKKIQQTVFVLCLFVSYICYSQDTAINVTNPLSSFPITAVKAEADQSTGKLVVQLTFENHYDKPLRAYFSLGDFENFGMEDSKGKKYKLHTSTKLIGTKNINDNYQAISNISFGKHKQDVFTYVQDTVMAGESKLFTFSVNKFDIKTDSIRKIVITCRPTVNFSSLGSKSYKIENLKVNWVNKKLL